jgi:hypothetical protein
VTLGNGKPEPTKSKSTTKFPKTRPFVEGTSIQL